MAKQLVNVGTSVNKGDGDPLRTAFQKINDNFNELYASTSLDLDSIGSNMIPTSDGGFALGSATKQWSDLYVRDFIYIGGTRLQSDAQGNITVDGGSLQIKDVQGDIFADDSTKVFDSSTQTFTGKFVGELVGTVAADDSTVLIDGVAGTINAGALTGALPAIDGSALTGISASSVAFSNVTGTPTTLAGYGITDASGIVLQSGSTQSIDVVAADSTMLVDSVNGTLNAATLTGALPAIDGSALTGVLTSGGDFEGNLSGSVFADDSTLLVDGVNGTVNISNQSIDALSDVNTTTYVGAPSRSMQPLIWDDIDNVWYPGNGISITANLTMEDNSFIMLRENAYLNFEGSITDGFDTKFLVVNPTANRTIRLPDADGTVALTNQLNGVTTGQYTGDVTGSVFGDDSTVLVDGVNGTLNSSALTKPIALADNEKITFGDGDDLEIYHSGTGSYIRDVGTGALVVNTNFFRIKNQQDTENMASFFNDGAVTLYYDNVAKFETTADGVSVTDHIALPDSGELRLGTDNDMQILHSGANGFVKSTTGTLVLQGPTVRIQDAGSAQTAISAADGIATLLFENTAVLNTTAGGIQIEQGVEEKFATLTGSTGVVAHDCDNGHVFYHTGASGDITANFTNLGLTAEYGTNLTVIINQGATPYEVTAVQIGGAAQTINWQGGSAPTGNANGIDSFSFTILRDGGSYVVLGQMVDFT